MLSRVALVRGVAGYSRQTFPWTICRSVRRSVGRSICLSSALWKNGGSDPDAVWHHRSDGSRDEARSGVWGSMHGKGYFWSEFGARHCNQWGLFFRSDAALLPNYFGQPCYYYFGRFATRQNYARCLFLSISLCTIWNIRCVNQCKQTLQMKSQSSTLDLAEGSLVSYIDRYSYLANNTVSAEYLMFRACCSAKYYRLVCCPLHVLP